MGRTTRFIKQSKKIVKYLESGKGNQDFLSIYRPYSKSKCAECGDRLYVENVIKSGSGVEYRFRCGHGLTTLSFPEIKSKGSGSAYSKVGITESGVHSVHTERVGDEYTQENDEIVLAKLFSHSYYPSLSIFKKDIQDSSVDVIATSKDSKEKKYFQITKIVDNKFWQSLSQTGKFSEEMPTIIEAVRKSIKNKMLKYPESDRNRIILLIDARPGVIDEIALQIKEGVENELEQASFKEVWIVGSVKILTHKIF